MPRLSIIRTRQVQFATKLFSNRYELIIIKVRRGIHCATIKPRPLGIDRFPNKAARHRS